MNHEHPINKPEQQKLPPDPSRFLSALEGHPNYLELTSQGKSRTEAISSTASLEYERSPDGPHSLPLRLLAITPGFEVAQTELNRMRKLKVSPEKIKPVKKEVIAFNHQLRDIIDHNPRLPVDELMQFIESSTLALSGPDVARQTRDDVYQVLRGMRHELAFEGLLHHLVDDSVVFDESNKTPEQLVDDELKGIDMVVEYKGRSIAVDVKASHESAVDTQKKNQERGNPAVALWSQFENRELGSNLQPDYNHRLIDQGSLAVLFELEQAYQNGNFYQDSTIERSRSLGSSAVDSAI